jgi:hypothetical protein
VRRLGRRAIQLFGVYVALLLAMIVAGFLGSAVGIWATVIWGLSLIGGGALYWRRRPARSSLGD